MFMFFANGCLPTGVQNFMSIHSTCLGVFANGCLQGVPTRTSPSHSTGASNGCLQRVPPTGASNWLTVWVPPTGASNGCQKFQEHSFYMFMGFLCQRVPPTGVKNFTSILSRVPWGFLANGCLPTGAKKLTSVHSTCLGFFCQRVLVQRMPNKIQWGNVEQKGSNKKMSSIHSKI